MVTLKMTKILIKPVTILLLFFLYPGLSPVNAQKLFLTPEDTYREACEYLLSEEPAEALPLFMQLHQKGFRSASLSYNLGKCYLGIPGNKELAVPYLEEAVKKVSREYRGELLTEDASPVDCIFLLSEAYRLGGAFDKSIKLITGFSDSLQFDRNENAEARLQIEKSENAIALLKAKMNLKLEQLGEPVNNGISNSNPLLSRDESLLYYISHLKFYDAVMRTSGMQEGWNEPENLTPDIKSDGDYLITGVSSDGATLYLCNYNPYTSGDIYCTHLAKGKWSSLTKLNENINSHYNETHASVSADGKTLYFTSNRDGGYGGMDIYRSERNEKNDWGPAVNLGPVINTAYDEETPFEAPDSSILFFSSRGHYNMGGYDIFFSEIAAPGKYSNPVNPGYPLNTVDDDLFYFPLKNGKTGYMARFTGTIGTSDIYRCEILSVANPARFSIKGRVDLPAETTVEKKDVTVTFIEKEPADTLGTISCDQSGHYTYKLPSGIFILNFYARNRFLDSKELSLPQDMPPGELVVESELFFEPEIQKDTLILKNIYFGFDQYNLPEKDLPFILSLVKTLEKYPQLTLSLIGNTDAIGSASYNRMLSLKRAGEVHDLLTDHGITDSRITVKGNGEENPVALNSNPDNTDNPEGRRFNRRVEITLKDIPENLVAIQIQDVPAHLMIRNKNGE